MNKGPLNTKCGINRCTHEAEEHREWANAESVIETDYNDSHVSGWWHK